MAAVTVNGVATSYDLPNYVGELFQKKQRPNAFLRLVGGLTGALRLVASTEFPMGVDYELPAGSQPDVPEAATPTASEVGTSQESNVVQIFQEAVELSYTRQATSGTMAGVAAIPGIQDHGALVNPGSLEWQIQRKLEKVANDANYSFLRGVYAKPASNATARRTRGVRTGIVTNVFDGGGTPRALTKVIFEQALRDMVLNGAFVQGAEVTAICDAIQFDALTTLYSSATQLPESREVAGVAIKRIITNWAVVNVVFDPDMAAGEILITQPGLCRVVALPIPEKGVLFVEPLAKSGSSEKYQLYGELGLDYMAEVFHGVIDDLS